MTTQMFIVRLENLCPTLKQLDALRNTASFAAFGKRWQLPVYYQLRFKDIAYRLEETLANKGGLGKLTSLIFPRLAHTRS